MNLDATTLYVLIIACEAAFWVLLLSGLIARYVFRSGRIGWVLLVCVPLIDIVLLALTVIDLRRGASATFAHGLATAYVAFTLAFGGPMIRWADEVFAHKFAGGPRPVQRYGWSSVLYEVKLWGRCIVAVAVIYALLIGMIAFVNDRARTEALDLWFRIPLGTIFFWFIFGPLWSLVFFKRADRSEPTY